jgi:hypothetical protein
MGRDGSQTNSALESVVQVFSRLICACDHRVSAGYVPALKRETCLFCILRAIVL